MRLKWVNFKQRVLRLLNIENCDMGRHPKDAVYYNEYSGVTQCLRCGGVTDWHGLTPDESLELAKRG